ncbi:MAG: hypothetical protein ACYSTZ_10835 [Planctomycetota bacterium]
MVIAIIAVLLSILMPALNQVIRPRTPRTRVTSPSLRFCSSTTQMNTTAISR